MKEAGWTESDRERERWNITKMVRNYILSFLACVDDTGLKTPLLLRAMANALQTRLSGQRGVPTARNEEPAHLGLHMLQSVSMPKHTRRYTLPSFKNYTSTRAPSFGNNEEELPLSRSPPLTSTLQPSGQLQKEEQGYREF